MTLSWLVLIHVCCRPISLCGRENVAFNVTYIERKFPLGSLKPGSSKYFFLEMPPDYWHKGFCQSEDISKLRWPMPVNKTDVNEKRVISTKTNQRKRKQVQVNQDKSQKTKIN